ncbi:MAG: restriction endonuclease subunit S [Xanthomonadales bacterium]|nr:restriction endonuclease subunit S [Xanthomonadales bacterium]
MTTDSRTFRLGDVCSKIGSGATPRGGSKVYLDSADVSLIRSQNVFNDGFKAAGLVYLSDEAAKSLEGVSVKSGDVLLNITGDSVARVCQAPESILPARVNQHVAIIRPDPKVLDAEYLRYVLITPEFQAILLSYASSGATRNALTKGMIEGLEITAPGDVGEQKRIARILGALDDKIELNRRMNQTLEAIARALFKSWFVDFDPVRAKAEGRDTGLPKHIADLFPDRFVDSDLGEIPEGWSVTVIGNVAANFDSRRVPLSKREREKRPGRYPYYGAASIMDYIDEYLFDGVYLLLGEDGTVTDSEGRASSQYVWGKFWTNNHAHVLKGKNGLSTEVLYLHFKQANISSYVTGAVQPKLNQRNLNAIPLVRACDLVLECFDSLVFPLFERIRSNSEEMSVLQELRDSLLPRLLSGELSDTEAA